MRNKIKVSVCCIAYNHEKFIRKCLEGFVTQKVDFEYEVLIHDDASTDSTAQIIKEYELKYPDIIKPIYQVENKYSQGIDPGPTYNFSRVRGDYIAMCEGDDYWTDPYKLQKQFDFLELNRDYGIVHTSYSSLVEETQKLVKKKSLQVPTGDIFEKLLKGFNSISTLTVLMRTSVFKEVMSLLKREDSKDWKMGDLPLWMGIAKYSKVGYISDNTAVYRVLNESASHSNESDKVITFYKSGFEIRRWFCYKFNLECFLDEIDENELYFLYYKTFLGDMSENKVYKEKITKNKIQYRSYWKTLMKLTAESKMFSYFFKKIYVVIYK